MPARYEQIAEWANAFGWELGVELGVFDGTTLFYLLDHCPELSMIGVDLWGKSIRTPTTPTPPGEKCRCEYCDATRLKRRSMTDEGIEATVINRGLIDPRATIYKMDTAEAAALSDLVDFVFVDGDHSTEGVVSDIKAWAQKIKPGGRLIGHDYNLKSVRDAVQSFYLLEDIHTEDDHVWWVAV